MELKDSVIETSPNFIHTRQTVDTNLAFLRDIYREYHLKSRLAFFITSFLMAVFLIVLLVGILSYDSKNGFFNSIPIICGVVGELTLGVVYWFYRKGNQTLSDLTKKIDLLLLARKQIGIIEISENSSEIEEAEKELNIILDEHFSISPEK